jgi:hypothetical protein
MASLPGTLAVVASALLLAGCASTERSAASVDPSPLTSASSVAAQSAASGDAASSDSAETSSSPPTPGALSSEAAVQGASKSTRVCVVNPDSIGNRFNRVIWYRYGSITAMKMPLNESVCAEGGFSTEPDVTGTITISDGTNMFNNTTEINFLPSIPS